MSDKVSELTAVMRSWTESAGKKPRSWTPKLPVGAVREMANRLDEAAAAEWREAGENVRRAQEWQTALRELLKRALPALEVSKAFFETGSGRPGVGASAAATMLNNAKEVAGIIRDAKEALARSEWAQTGPTTASDGGEPQPTIQDGQTQQRAI